MIATGILPKTVDAIRSTFSSLESRDYRYYWLSMMASSAAMQMQLVVRGIQVLRLTNSAGDLGLVSLSAGVPILLLSPFAGVIADRVDKRQLLITTQALFSMATLAIAILIAVDVIQLWHLIVAAIINGVTFSFNMPGRQAMIPNLVEQRYLMNAVALNSGAQNLNRVLGSALGGIFVAIIDISGVYFFMFACSIASTIFLFFIPSVRKPARDRKETIFSDLIDGARYVQTRPALLGLLTMAIIPILFGMPYILLMPIFATDVLDAGDAGNGYLLAATGAGALVGSILVAMLSDFKHKGWLLLGGAIGFGAFLALFGASHNFWLSWTFLLGVGLCSSTYMAANNSLMLLLSEDRVRGRIMSLYMMTIGIFPIAVYPAGILIDRLDNPGLVVGAGGLIIVVFALGIAVLRPALRKL